MILVRRRPSEDSQEVGATRRAERPVVERPERRVMVPGQGSAYGRSVGPSPNARLGAPARIGRRDFGDRVGPLPTLLAARAGMAAMVRAVEQSIYRPRDRAEGAQHLASLVLQGLGLSLPPVRWVRGSDAYALGNQITMGTELAARLSLATLTQILLHEAGHVHEGHSDVLTNLILNALTQEGCLHPAVLRALNQGEERTADVYAAIGAWMFEPGARPSIARWLAALGHGASDTHPSSAERARNVSAIVQALDLALAQELAAGW